MLYFPLTLRSALVQNRTEQHPNQKPLDWALLMLRITWHTRTRCWMCQWSALLVDSNPSPSTRSYIHQVVLKQENYVSNLFLKRNWISLSSKAKDGFNSFTFIISPPFSLHKGSLYQPHWDMLAAMPANPWCLLPACRRATGINTQHSSPQLPCAWHRIYFTTQLKPFCDPVMSCLLCWTKRFKLSLLHFILFRTPSRLWL